MTDSLTVLVVDDDENLGEIMSEALSVAGYEVQTARDGLHGIARCMERLPNVVLTDIQMPGLNGIEMMRRIRAINPRVKTIYISGAVHRYRDVLAMEDNEHGAIVLNKPFSRHQVLGLLAGWRGAGVENSLSAPRNDFTVGNSPALRGQLPRCMV